MEKKRQMFYDGFFYSTFTLTICIFKFTTVLLFYFIYWFGTRAKCTVIARFLHYGDFYW